MENKEAKWEEKESRIKVNGETWGDKEIECTRCHYTTKKRRISYFCPNCGAAMKNPFGGGGC